MLNYDVLFIVFIKSLVDWEKANLTLASVCRNWRHAALATPQIWSRINFDAFVHPNYYQLCLDRSGTAPLHVAIPLLFSTKLVEVFPSITTRIVCMKITDSYRFLCNQFPTLERLELVCSIQDLAEDEEGRRFLSDTSRFPRLRELCISESSEELLGIIMMQNKGFWGLEKLAIPCDYQRHWASIIEGVSSTLVSLHLDVRYSTYQPIQVVSLPRLRHLQITMRTPVPLELDVDAPLPESVDEGHGFASANYVTLMLRHPRCAKELCSGNFPITMGHYPELRRLWIRDCTPSNGRMIESLKARICDWPGLETVMYSDSSKYRKTKVHEAQIIGAPPPHGPVFWEIWDVIHATGMPITLREFVLSDMSLPGSIPRKVCVSSSTFHDFRRAQQDIERMSGFNLLTKAGSCSQRLLKGTYQSANVEHDMKNKLNSRYAYCIREGTP